MAKTPSVPQQLSASWCFTFTAESCSQITWAQPQQHCIHQDTCTDPDFSALSKLLRVGALSTALDLLPCKGTEGHAAGRGTRRSASDIVGGLGCACCCARFRVQSRYLERHLSREERLQVVLQEGWQAPRRESTAAPGEDAGTFENPFAVQI